DLDLLFLLCHSLRTEPRVFAQLADKRTRTAKHRCAARHHCSKWVPIRARIRLSVRIRGPSSVTATVCSKCAERESSELEIDHSSSWTTMSGPPALIIGSIANTIPGASAGPRPGGP